MSHFYGSVQGNRGQATRGGTKTSGYHTIAASWDGAIEVELSYDPKTDTNHYVVYQSKWHGKGVEQPITSGIIGDDRCYGEYNKGFDDGYELGYLNASDDSLGDR